MHQASLSEEIGRQFRQPTGMFGAWMGRFMRLINRRANALAIEALAIIPGDRVLELGFGPGEAIAAMVRLADWGTVFGVDRSDVMLAQATSRNAEAVAAGRARLQRGDFALLPFEDGTIDKVLAVNVVYFCNSQVISQIRRVLRPGGLLALYATDESVMRKWTFAGPQTHRLFNAESLKSLLSRGGFVPDDVSIRHVNAGMGVRGLVAVVTKNSTQH